MNYSKPISELLDDVRKIYIDQQNAQGIRSSGKSAESLRTEAKERSGLLYGARYFHQQKFGRKPGKFPPIDEILDWIRAKGIKTREDGTTERQLAFLFARKIAQSGTDIFQGKREGLEVDEKIDQRVKLFTAMLAKKVKNELVTMLREE